MAIETNTYGSLDGLQRLIRDIPDGGEFGDDTTPTRTDAEAFINEVADELNEALRAAGYTVPVASTGDDVEANGRLARVNNMGAAATILGSYPPEAFDPDNPDMKNRMDFWMSRFSTLIEDIREGNLAATRTTSKLGRVFSGGQEDKNSNTKKPAFTRTDGFYPGTRTLIDTP